MHTKSSTRNLYLFIRHREVDVTIRVHRTHQSMNFVIIEAGHLYQTNVQLCCAFHIHAIVNVHFKSIRCPNCVYSVAVNGEVRVRII